LSQRAREGREAWNTLQPKVSRRRSPSTEEFRQKVVQRAREYLIAAGQAGLAETLNEHEIAIDLPEIQGIAGKTHFYVGDEVSGIQPYSDLFNVERWSEAYENQKNIGYAYCWPAYAPAVHIAVRDLIKEESGLTFDSRSLGMTKLSPNKVSEFIEFMRRGGRGTEVISVPVPLGRRPADESEIIRTYKGIIESLGSRFRTFESHTGDLADTNRIVRWLQQFQVDELLLAVKVLQRIRYWDRRAIDDALKRGVEWIRARLGKVQLLPLGGPTTSGHHLSYYWPDVIMRGPFAADVKHLGSVDEIRIGEPLVLYDDNIGRGNQSKTVLQQWFGRSPEEWFLDEDHVTRLSPEAVERLRLCPIAFLFVTGQRRGLEELVTFAKDLLGHDKISGHIVAPVDAGCFEPSEGAFLNDEEANRAKQIFAKAGEQALADMLSTWGREKVDNRVLGYGNFGGLTVFHYNVPSSTLTALWKDCGQNPGWMALFHRRRRI
jgi:hypothetical protein